LRRYTKGGGGGGAGGAGGSNCRARAVVVYLHGNATDLGRMVQVEAMESKLKPPGTNRLKLKYNIESTAFQTLLSKLSCAATPGRHRGGGQGAGARAGVPRHRAGVPRLRRQRRQPDGTAAQAEPMKPVLKPRLELSS
jgi:hypothetical protein